MKGRLGHSLQSGGFDVSQRMTTVVQYAKSRNALVVVGALFAIVIFILLIFYALQKKKIESAWKDSIYIKNGLIVGDNKEKVNDFGNIVLYDSPESYLGGDTMSFVFFMHVNHIGRNINKNRNIFVMPFKAFKKTNINGQNTLNMNTKIYYDVSNNPNDVDHYHYTFTNDRKVDLSGSYTSQINSKPIGYVGLPDATTPTTIGKSSTTMFQNNFFIRAYLKKYANDVVVELQTGISPSAPPPIQVIIRNIPIQTWFSVGVVVDTGVLSVYVDGAHYLSKTFNTNTGGGATSNISDSSVFGTVGHPVYLGQGLLPASDTTFSSKMSGSDDNARFYPFNGVLASFIITNQALTPEMIRNINDTGLTDEARRKAKTVAEPTCEDLTETRNAASN